MEISSPKKDLESRTLTQRLRDAVESNDKIELEILLQSGVDPNHQYTEHRKYTPLHFAAKLGHTEIIDILLAAGADTSIKNKRGFTPLLTACLRSQCDVFLKLLPVTKCRDFTYHPLVERMVHDLSTWQYIMPEMKRLMFRASPCMEVYCRRFAILHVDRCMKLMVMCGKDIYDTDINWFIENIVQESEAYLDLVKRKEFPFIINPPLEVINEQKDFLTFIENIKTKPPSLKHICRLAIRDSFDNNCNVFYGVKRLCLPEILKDYICFTGVDIDRCLEL